MQTNQTKIMAANSTVIKLRKADPHASLGKTQKEDGRSKASRRREEHSTEHAITAGRRFTVLETVGVKGAEAKASRRSKGGDAKSELTTATAATREEASSRTCAMRNHLHLNRSPLHQSAHEGN